MPSKHSARLIYEISRQRNLPSVPFHNIGIISVRDKANILTVRFRHVNKAILLRNLANFCFGQFSERKHRMGKLLLVHRIQNIALVF